MSDRREAIGKALKALFDDTLAEPVPEHLLELTRKLDRKAGRK